MSFDDHHLDDFDPEILTMPTTHETHSTIGRSNGAAVHERRDAAPPPPHAIDRARLVDLCRTEQRVFVSSVMPGGYSTCTTGTLTSIARDTIVVSRDGRAIVLRLAYITGVEAMHPPDGSAK